jgi:hypothetical protein
MSGSRYPFYIMELVAFGLALILIVRNWRVHHNRESTNALVFIVWIVAMMAFDGLLMSRVVAAGWHDAPGNDKLAWGSSVVRLIGGVILVTFGLLNWERRSNA